jgi:hypothetical protein
MSAPVGTAPYMKLLLHPSRDLRVQDDIVKMPNIFFGNHKSSEFLSM